jgi:methionyl-tRNA formyltransferase
MSLKFKIGYFADGPWSHKAFEKIIKDQTLDICFIVPRSDTQDKTLQNYANQYEIEYLYPIKVNDPNFIDKIISYKCDLLVSMSFDQIFKSEISKATRLGIINCHAGKLPFYRGRNVLTWAIINDEKEFGITVHFVDTKIDTGDIILQRVYPINDDDDYASILKKAYEECANILYDGLKKVQSGNYDRILQNSIDPIGMYCGRRVEGDEIIDWNNSSRSLYNFIRALTYPGPSALSFYKGNVVKINAAKIIAGAPNYINTPGQILNKTQNGFIVKTKDSFIEILNIETAIKLKVGDKLSSK